MLDSETMELARHIAHVMTKVPRPYTERAKACHLCVMLLEKNGGCELLATLRPYAAQQDIASTCRVVEDALTPAIRATFAPTIKTLVFGAIEHFHDKSAWRWN